MAPPPSHGEHIARMKAKGQKPAKADEQWFKSMQSWTISMQVGWYERFRSWLQGYAWKPFCRHWFIFDRYCKECDAKYCHKCYTKFPRERLRPPTGEVVHFKHNH